MRRALIWSLVATSVASLAALWTPRAPGLVAAIDARVNPSLQLAANVQKSSQSSRATAPLPANLSPLVVGQAKRDIFIPIQSPLSVQVPPAPTAPSTPGAATVAVEPTPQPPPANARYLGAMTGPDGKRLGYLVRGDASIAVSAGQQLDDGYVVEAISPDAVTLLYPPLDARVKLPVPQAPVQ